jgi:carbon storage regulator CsrA
MLVLRRKTADAIVIDGTIRVKVLRITGQTICLGIEAPPEVSIRRSELVPFAGDEGEFDESDSGADHGASAASRRPQMVGKPR